MAEGQEFDKTELPTPRRREEARRQGQFAFSPELINGALLYTGALCLSWMGTSLTVGLKSDLRFQLGQLSTDITVDSVQSRFHSAFGSGMQLVGGMVAVMFVIGVAANLIQAGFHVNTESLGPKWDKLNPAINWQKLLSLDSLLRGGVALLKVIVVGAVAWWVLSDRGAFIGSLAEGVLGRSVSEAWGLSIELLTTIAAVMLTLGVADYGYHWYRNERRLMMTREEMKQEHKEQVGDPLIMAKRRQRAREIVNRRRMLKDVAKASVVITNPTHLAVALKYERGVDTAPIVVAKGADQFALTLAAKARRHGVPVVERKPVAQALYKTVPVGKEIPQALFLAVSEVLAYIYRLRNATG
jgi:flagellar biosynthetic protein FlhB